MTNADVMFKYLIKKLCHWDRYKGERIKNILKEITPPFNEDGYCHKCWWNVIRPEYYNQQSIKGKKEFKRFLVEQKKVNKLEAKITKIKKNW